MMDFEIRSSDLIENKNPRIPVCIAVEMSDRTLSAVSAEITMRNTVEEFLNYMKNNAYLANSVDLCVICFGNETKVVSPYGLISAKDNLRLEHIGGIPDLKKLLRILIHEQRMRHNDYDNQGVSKYTPILMIISSGISSTAIEEESAQLKHWDLTGRAHVIPVMFGNKEGKETLLADMTYDGTVYQIDELDFGRMFDQLSKDIESLSMSVLYTLDNIKSKSKNWNEFKRK